MKYLHIFLCLIAVLSLAGCGGAPSGHDEHDGHEHGEEGHDHAEEEAHAKGVVVFTQAQAKAGGVQTETVQAGPFASVIRCSGRIGSAQGDERTVAATAPGIVSFAASQLTPGAAVGAGQTLFRISSKGIATDDDAPRLRAELASAQTRLKRVEGLMADKLATQAEYDQAVADVAAAKASLSIHANHAENGAVERSPISGYIAQCMVRPGDYVELGAPLATVTTNRLLQLTASVPQKYVALMPRITGANIVLPFREDETVQLAPLGARVLSYGRGAGAGSLYIPLTLEFRNPGDIPAGASVDAYLLAGTRPDVISVPRQALTEEEGVYFVYVQTEPEHYRKQRVEPGTSDGARVEILSGLRPGEVIVTRGSALLKLAANSGKAPQGHTHNH